MSMLLLHNIAYCNNIVAIQCSVSMYTEEFAQYTFIQDNRGCDKACVTCSSTHVFMTLSLAGGQWLPCVSTPTEQVEGARHLLHSFTNLRIHEMKIHTVNYV